MSTKSKSSQQSGGCCNRRAALIIDYEWRMYVLPPALLFPSWDSLYLSNTFSTMPLKYEMRIVSNASDKCKEMAKDIIESRMVQSINEGFRAWKRIATQQQRVLFQLGGTLLPVPLVPYDEISFNIEPKSWNFNIKCCDKYGVASITSFSGFPRIYGFQAMKARSGGLPGWSGPILTPRIIGAPITH